MADSSIKWEGDLNDDCTAEFGRYTAHAECMDTNSWYCGVYIKGKPEYIFHSSAHDTLPLSGDAARRLCELIMRAAHMGVIY